MSGLAQRLRLRIGRFLHGRGRAIASRLRIERAKLLNPRATVIVEPSWIGPNFVLDAPHGGTLIIRQGAQLRRYVTIELGGPDAVVEIGPGVQFTQGGVIQCTTRVTIEREAWVGQAIMIVDGNHRFRDPEADRMAQGYEYSPITIGEEAMLYTKATIVANVGRRGVVASHAVVTRDVPPYTLVGGIPAKVIDYFGPPGGEPEGWEPRGSAASKQAT